MTTTLTRTAPAAGDPPPAWHVHCAPCEHTGPPLDHPDQADQLAAVHDHLHHRGRPTATARQHTGQDAS